MHALVEENRRLVSAQSTPLLMLDSGNIDDDGKPALSMTLSNVGTGPAQIAWFHIADEGGTDYTGGTLYERVAKVDPGVRFTSEQIGGTLMRSGDYRSVFRWPKPVDNEEALAEYGKLNAAQFKLHASACYCSIFEECRVTEFGDSRPRPVSSCKSAAHGGD